MSDEKKKLMNEVLPAPTVISQGPSVRDRVTQKMKLALAAGVATATINSCSTPPFGVVDPLPPPAACADMGPTASVTAAASPVANSAPPQVHLAVDSVKQAGMTFEASTSIDGGTIVSQSLRSDPSDESEHGTFLLQADANATQMVLRMPINCRSSARGINTDSILVFTVSMLSSTPSVVVTGEAAPDGGVDGGP
ncbi:MAG: hypothetical protein QM723_07215 [Myxococcaceae bacterium]